MGTQKEKYHGTIACDIIHTQENLANHHYANKNCKSKPYTPKIKTANITCLFEIRGHHVKHEQNNPKTFQPNKQQRLLQKHKCYIIIVYITIINILIA